MTSRIAICVTAILAVVFLAATAHCQQPDPTKAAPPPPATKDAATPPVPAPPLMSSDDKFEGRTLELEETQALAAVQQSPQYQAAMTAQQRRAAFFRSLFDKYHLDAAKYTICDGPGQPPTLDPSCKGVVKGDIQWRAVVAPSPAPAATGPKK